MTGSRGPTGILRARRVERTSGRAKYWLSLMSAGVALLIICPAVQADEVVLTNGDRVTGTVKGLAGGKLKIETPYAESLELDWASVREVRTEAPVEFVLKDGTHLKGTVRMTPGGDMEVVTGSAGSVVLEDMLQVDQVNPPEVPAVTYTGDLQAGASYLTGNTDTTSANLSGKFVARSKRQRFTLRGRWYYAENDDMVTAREAGGTVKYDFFMTEKLYLYVNTLLDYNAFQDLDLRTTLGGGLGYQIWEDERKKLGVEFGASYVDENFRIAMDESYASARWAIDADYQLVPAKIALFHYQEGYLGLEDTSDLVLRTEQGVRFNVLENFYTTFQANVTYDNSPSPGFEKTDTALLFGLGYNFDL